MTYRDDYFEDNEEECEVCGYTENIVVHHIDADRSNDNHSNLIALCNHHHMRVHYGVDVTGDVADLQTHLPDENTTRTEPPITPQELETAYVDEGKTLREVGEAYSISPSTVLRWANRYGITTRGRTDYTGPRNKPWNDPEKLRELYHDRQLTTHEIADELGCHQKTILNWFGEYGIEPRRQGARRVERCGHRISDDGYETATAYVDCTRKAVPIHRLIAVAEWGFDEISGKVVRFKNGVKMDVRVENLEPATVSQSVSAQHERGLI